MGGLVGPEAITRADADTVLAEWVRPVLRGHGGDVRVVDVTPGGSVMIEFLGACRFCPMQPVTLGVAVRPAFDGVAGVTMVECNTVRVSPHAMQRMAELMGSSTHTSRDAGSTPQTSHATAT